MKIAPSFLALALMAGFAVGASAQTAASAPAVRADVKAEAKLNKLPAGESPAASDKASAVKSTKARADVKEEIRKAVKAGETPKAGEVAASGAMASSAKSTKARADVKAEAKASVKAGAVPAGEAERQPRARTVGADEVGAPVRDVRQPLADRARRRRGRPGAPRGGQRAGVQCRHDGRRCS